METQLEANHLERIEELENRLADAEQLIEAIKAGEVDAFALRSNNKSEVFTLQSGDYAYRVLVENFNEGALNITEEGLIVYSNKYFHELLGLPYEKVIGTSLREFLHPESIATFNFLFSAALNGQSKGEINLMGAANLVPVYISLTSLYPQLPTIGAIVTDLTAKKENEEIKIYLEEKVKERTAELQTKNIALENTNAELASFSYVASHDLKEPLRKIQTYSGRILELENFSGATQDYFNRIIKSSERMQNLIDSLLEFSRANMSELIFEPCDLNTIVEESISDLHLSILKKQATIEYNDLPTIQGGHIQLSQLFTNLLDNAIKYSRTEIKPLIKITSSIVKGKKIEHSSANHQKEYHEIKIADNGIGFEKEYVTKIFELFQRLHHKNEYSGTGIGLAIVKKIVGNHNGFITADGRSDIGSTFTIYLPTA